MNCVYVTGKEYVTRKDCSLVTGNQKTRTLSNVYYHVANLAPFAGGSPQKKGVIPDHHLSIKSVKGVSCVGQLSSVNCVTNAPTVAIHPPVGARFLQFWQKWAALGVSPKVVTVLKEGYTFPFRFRPNLTRSPKVISCYVNPYRNLYLLEALHQLMHKNAVEPVTNQTSLGFYNQLFLVPKPNNWWRPILDLSNLNKFLKTESFKMETPETIRTFLQAGEWVYCSTSRSTHHNHFHPLNFNQQRHQCHLPLIKSSQDLPASPAAKSAQMSRLACTSHTNRPF